MEGFIEQIFNIYGIYGVSAFLVIVLLVKYHKQIKSAFKGIFNNQMNAILYSPKAILKSKLTYWRDFKIDSLEMAEYGRTKIFRDLLHHKFDAYDRKLTTIENSDGFAKLSRRELFSSFVTYMHDIVDDYEINAKADGIPSVVIAKYKQWHSKSLDFTLKSAELITQSPIYNTNEDIMSAIYLLNISLLELTIAEAEKTLSDLNGELTGVVYKGYTIG